jgi:D-glycero-alpha-D-manno-heptose 1-phosphate guanylyltransferase
MRGDRLGASVAVLAGGLGTRLRPAFADHPKVLAPVHGRPFLTYLLDHLAGAGAGEVVLRTGHRADEVRAALGGSYAGLRLVYSAEPSPLGTAGALRHALPLLGAETILLLNGDSFCDVDLAALARRHRAGTARLTMALARVPDASRFGRVERGPGGRVLRFEEKREEKLSGWVNAGVYLLDRALVGEEVPAGRPVSLEREVLPALAARGLVRGFPSPGPLLDIGTPESYAGAGAFFEPAVVRGL